MRKQRIDQNKREQQSQVEHSMRSRLRTLDRMCSTYVHRGIKNHDVVSAKQEESLLHLTRHCSALPSRLDLKVVRSLGDEAIVRSLFASMLEILRQHAAIRRLTLSKAHLSETPLRTLCLSVIYRASDGDMHIFLWKPLAHIPTLESLTVCLEILENLAEPDRSAHTVWRFTALRHLDVQ